MSDNQPTHQVADSISTNNAMARISSFTVIVGWNALVVKMST